LVFPLRHAQLAGGVLENNGIPSRGPALVSFFHSAKRNAEAKERRRAAESTPRERIARQAAEVD
jgi:hypothetical protein